MYEHTLWHVHTLGVFSYKLPIFEKKRKMRPAKEIKKHKPKNIVLEVKQENELMLFLMANLSSKSRNNIKSLLKNKQVVVDGIAISQYNHVLSVGQKVEILAERQIEQQTLKGLKLIYEDDYLIVIEKNAGTLSVATEKEKNNTAYSFLSDYVKSQNPNYRIFVVHRLDRETSGIMMYAKSQRIQKLLQESWNDSILERTYVAVVEGEVKNKKDTIISHLVESKALMVYSTKNTRTGQLAITHYETVEARPNYSLLKLNLETGRKNQIRVHMHDIGHSIIGDEKYGARTNPIRRLGLHALVLAFHHPILDKPMRFETQIPKAFVQLFD